MRVSAIALLVILGAVAGACASDRGARPHTFAGAWATAVALATNDARLSRVVAARRPGEGWEKDGEHFTSPGWRAVKDKHWSELGARLPSRADGTFEVGVSQFPALRLRITPRDAEAATAEARGGHVLYAGAYGAKVDVLMTTTRDTVEELLVLHDAAAPATFSWDVELPAGIVRGVLGADGALRFEDARGQHVMRVPAPYAVDAHGVTRTARLTWEPGRLGVALETSGLAFPVMLDPAFETSTWEQLIPLPARTAAAMAYDEARGRVILFGGYGSTGPLADTWAWNGITWSNVTTFPAPSPRSSHAMTYDAARQRVILFGGVNNNVEPKDTWTWDGSGWTNVTPTSLPPSRYNHAMAYDAARRQVVLFGGHSGSFTADLSSTWTWDGVSWTKIMPPSSPPRRESLAMAYDAKRQKVVLFGGALGSAMNDTWTWDGATWTSMPTAPASTPPVRSSSTMAYDAKRERAVLFGGSGGSGVLNDTWTWDGSAWTQLSPATAAPARYGHTMAYDAARMRIVICGGNAPALLGDTWTWDGTSWLDAGASPPASTPSLRSDHAMAYDAARGRVVMFGGYAGTAVDETWTWDGSRWTKEAPATSPPARFDHSMAYDAPRQVIVTFGGNGPALLNDTWTWNGSTWTLMPTLPTVTPSPRAHFGMAYDGATQRVVLFGGTTGGTTSLRETWTWDGATWANVTPALASDSPSARMDFAMASTRTGVLVFGGYGFTTGRLNDTWTWNGAAWSKALVALASSPPARDGHAAAYDAARDRVVVFGGEQQGSGGDLGDTWTWDGTAWTEVTPLLPSPSPRGRAFFPMAYDGARRRVVLFSGDSAGANDTWLYATHGGGCTLGTECASGSCVDNVCCDVPACGTCEACDTAASPGVCGQLRGAPDPDTCDATRACDASGACKPALGQACTAGTGCASGICADGVCCDSACAGLCQACTAALKTSGADGTCGPAKAGVDPHDDCPDEGKLLCRRDGQCDGTGRCRIYAPGTSCGTSICVQNKATGPVCDGLGACGSNATGIECAPFVCSITTNGCADPCASDDDCVKGNYCDAGACKARRAYGAACVAAAECPIGGFCADGVCCNTPCKGQCESCDSTAATGSCIPTQGAPRSGRAQCAGPTLNNACSATSCDGVQADACHGFVGAGTSCRAASCANGVATAPASCTGRGQCQDLVTSMCTPYVCLGTGCGTSCASDADCDPKFTCAPDRTCVARDGASCDNDHTLTNPDGTTSSCAPYKCAGSTCLAACASIRECAYPNECTAKSYTCVPPLDPRGPASTPGCACRATGPGGDSRTAGIVAGALLALFAARRRSRISGTSPASPARPPSQALSSRPRIPTDASA